MVMSASSRRGRSAPKTWDSAKTRRAVGSRRGGRSYSSKANAARAAKEAEAEALEVGLTAYSYRKPVGPALEPGTKFLQGKRKASVSKPDGPRLREPGMAYTEHLEEAEDLVNCLQGPLGLDLEWNFEYGRVYKTALLQICSTNLIILIHLSSIKTVPPSLVKVLQDPAVIKTGVAIRNDALKLQRDFNIQCRNIVELSQLAKLAEPERWASTKYLISLRALTRVYLGQKLRKDEERVSDWTKRPLSDKQIEYAASDVFVGLELLRKLAAFFPSEADAKDDAHCQHDDGSSSTPAPASLVAQLEALDSNVQEKEKETQEASKTFLSTTMEKALRLSSYDLLQERQDIEAVEQKRQALRKVQVQAKAPLDDDDDGGFVVTKVMLAHQRAMHAWLYESMSIQQLALSRSIRPTTAAGYILKALFEAKGTTLLDDFTDEHRLRLEQELKEGGQGMSVARKRFRGLSRALGWSGKAKDSSAASSAASSDSELETRSSSSDQETQAPGRAQRRATEVKAVCDEIDFVWDEEDEIEVVESTR